MERNSILRIFKSKCDFGTNKSFWKQLTSRGARLSFPLDDEAASTLGQQGRFLLLHHSGFTLTRLVNLRERAFFDSAVNAVGGGDWMTRADNMNEEDCLRMRVIEAVCRIG